MKKIINKIVGLFGYKLSTDIDFSKKDWYKNTGWLEPMISHSDDRITPEDRLI